MKEMSIENASRVQLDGNIGCHRNAKQPVAEELPPAAAPILLA
jgi:hypothetical protein